MENLCMLDTKGASASETMYVNEAIKKVSKDNSEFLVFRDKGRKGKPVTVVYMRDCGDCGILEV